MKQEMRGLLAIVLSMAVFAIWFTWIAPPKHQPTAVVNSEQPVVPSAKPLQDLKIEDQGQKTAPESLTTVETDFFKATFSNQGGSATEWLLKKFRKGKEPINLVGLGTAPFSLEMLDSNFAWPARPQYSVVKTEINSNPALVFQWKGSGVTVRKQVVFDPHSYAATVTLSVHNGGNALIQAKPVLRWEEKAPDAANGGFFRFLKGPPDVWATLYLLDGSVKREHKPKEATASVAGKLYWAGQASRYFLAAYVPHGGGDRAVDWGVLPADTGGSYVRLIFAPFQLAAGGDWQEDVALYVGPQEINALKGVGQRLEESIDYGWFGIIARPILGLLNLFYRVAHNYGVAIILLTLFLKLLLHPINKKSMLSMKAMQALQPRLKEIREKYKNDKQRVQMEMMGLFKLHKVNPMGGCLPMLLQFPIYIALYKVLWNSVELYQAPFFWFYKDLSAPDPYLISPILLGIAMFFQQKMMPAVTADPAQQKMMTFMPLMFAGFMIFLPSGLTIYIFVNTVTSIAQQWMTQKGLRLRDVIRGRFYSADGAK